MLDPNDCCIFHEFEDAGNNLPVLRTVHGAHDYDISTVAHSHILNLVATGDSNGIVKIWDFQFGTHEGAISVNPTAGYESEMKEVPVEPHRAQRIAVVGK